MPSNPKKKLGFVDGNLTKPTSTGLEVRAWEKCDSIVTACLCNMMDKTLHRSATYASRDREIWIDLQERYLQASSI